MSQYDILFTRNDHASGIEFTEIHLGKPAASGMFLTQHPTTGVLSWSKTLESPVFNGTVSGTAIITDLNTAPAAGKLIDALTAKNYIDSLISANDAMVYKGAINCSASPNYPAGDAGWTWRVSAAGKIGGASGINVETGDLIICHTDNAGGTHATVGTNFNIIQVNLDGAITDGMFSGTGLMKRTGAGAFSIITDNSTNWNTAFSWGSHSGLYAPLSHVGSSGDAHAVATDTISGFMSAGDKAKLNLIESQANKYIHPTGDGNLHVPANGTSNLNKVLKASATAGSYTWAFVDWTEVTSKPSTFAPSAHTHAISDVTGLQTALDAKLNTWVSAPASATSSGSAGQIARDTSFIYICTAANTWRRSALASWT